MKGRGVPSGYVEGLTMRERRWRTFQHLLITRLVLGGETWLIEYKRF